MSIIYIIIYIYMYIFTSVFFFLFIYIYIYISLSLLMRHVARTPLPPDFVACGLFQLTSFGKSQNIAQRFEVKVRDYTFFASSPQVFCIEVRV